MDIIILLFYFSGCIVSVCMLLKYELKTYDCIRLGNAVYAIMVSAFSWLSVFTMLADGDPFNFVVYRKKKKKKNQ